ncbi:hypothetical protein JRQ81_000016 [Phrynocephalus forsythii]|uniref:Uncharacterized protein n=1 Tax=Phrynocephalus forsythii TaxID=171643 RepID=A0A9Q0X583_9SAUR|nr:hypothetical protein JRQ81_000016 [Phrynocephalus forsythii]
MKAMWRKDGEVSETKTHGMCISPNSDRNYYTWLSVEIDGKEKDLCWFHMEHNCLSESLHMA